MAQQRYNEAEAHRTDRFNRLALVFTLFTVLSSGTVLADFVVGGAILGVNETRLVLLATMTVAFSCWSSLPPSPPAPRASGGGSQVSDAFDSETARAEPPESSPGQNWPGSERATIRSSSVSTH